jgi:hypothetical protein
MDLAATYCVGKSSFLLPNHFGICDTEAERLYAETSLLQLTVLG